MADILLDPRVEELARQGAWFVTSTSGGKDSSAAMRAADVWLDSVGHPRNRRLALHADLGRAEWHDTLDTVRSICAHLGLPLEVVSQKNDLLWRFDDRWTRCLRRYAALETIAVVPPWSTPDLLFCRSEQKSVPLSRRKSKLPGGLPVVGIVGLRREESERRSRTPVLAPDADMIRRNGRDGYLWNPIADWSTDQVFEYHREHDIPLHRAYGLGSTRLSCRYCIMGSRKDITVSFGMGGDLVAFHAYSALEIRSAFSFQGSTWLSDLGGPELVDQRRLADAKRIAAERNEIQRLIPRHILKAKSIRNIDGESAEALAGVRRRIAALYGIQAVGTTRDGILEMAREAA